MTLLKQQAIHTALLGNWDNAVSLNKELLKDDPDDIEALNRLAFALAALGKIRQARLTYQKVLQLDNQNPIALKNLKRLQSDKNTDARMTSSFSRLSDSMYLEESGKTKVVELVNVAEPKIVSHLITGEFVNMRIKRLKVFVLDEKTRYIGMVPDNIGKRLIRFLKGGNTYDAYVKSVTNNKVAIFIKETKRAPRFKNQPSFISDRSHLALDKNSIHMMQTRQKNTSSELEDEDYSSTDESL